MTQTKDKQQKNQRTKRSITVTSFLTLLMLSVGLFQAVSAQSTAQEGFPDVNDNDSRKTAINYFLDQNVFTGYPDGAFQPEKILNRAEQLKVYMLLMGIDPTTEKQYSNCFPDVKEEWFASYVCYAKEQGIVEGYPDKTFRPAQEVNKAEALKMLGVLQKWNVQTPTKAPFTDTPVSEWYTPYVTFAKEHNFLGTTAGTLNPAGGIPRANTAELMFRSLALYGLNQSFYDSLKDDIQAISLKELAEEKNTTATATQETQQTAAPTIAISSMLPQSGTVPVGEYYTITIRSAAPPELFFEWPLKKETEGEQPGAPIITETIQDGVYSAQVRSTIAGSNILAIRNKETGETVRRSFIFTAATPEVLEAEQQTPAEGEIKKLGTREYRLMLRDRYGNTIRNAEFRAEATNAQITMQPHADGTATAQVKADSYGLSQVVFTGASQGIEKQQTELLDFMPIGLHANAAYPEGAQGIRIPVLFFLPKYGDQNMDIDYIVRIPRELNVSGFSPKTTVFAGEVDQTLEAGVNYLRIKGHLVLEKSFDGAIGDIIIEQMPEGAFTLDGGITMTTEGVLPTGIHRPGGATQLNDEEEIYVSLPRPLADITGKTEKRICIDAFIDPASGVTAEQVESDAKQAEDIFHKNAEACNCPHWLKIDMTTYTFPQDQWNDVTGGDDVLDSGDVKEFLKSKTPVTPHTWCTKVFYTGRTGGEEAGNSVRISDPNDEIDGVGSFITVNNAKDHDGRTLAHELAHHLSGNQIQDPGKGAAQGAGRQGNLMSYDDTTGDDLTKAQCDLIDWSHPRFDAYPPAP